VPFGQPASPSSASTANSPMAQQRQGSWGLLDACRVSSCSACGHLCRPVLTGCKAVNCLC
jgi:hypothetical protein